MFVRNSIIIFGTAALLYSCAAINNPEGGPKDLTNPKLVATFPIDKSVNINTKIISLTFDEEVQAPNLQNQLQISPNTEPKYTVKTEKNSVFLTFEENLEPNTTYQFNFKEGIQDITESNKAQGVILTFSTGPELDSAQLRGTVKNLLTNVPEPNMVVALYPADDTANIRKNKPYYFTQTTSAGTFQFTNIKANKYHIFAHRDKNNNQFYDNDNESIGYLSTTVEALPADTIPATPIELLTGKADAKKPFVFKKDPYTDSYSITYSEGIEKVEIKPVSNPTLKNIPYTVSTDGKIIRLFPTTNFKEDRLILTATDSSTNIGIDTIKVAFTGNKAFKNPGEYKVANISGNIAPDQTIELQFDLPISEIKPGAFTLTEDTIKTRKLDTKEYRLSETKTSIILTPKIKAKRNIAITADSTSIISVSGTPLKLNPLKLNITDQLTTGSISGIIKTSYKSYQIELINSAGQVIKSVRNATNFLFNNLAPGSFTWRVKIDENNNQYWEGIQKDLKTMPEKIYHHKEPVEIRANWDIEDYILEF